MNPLAAIASLTTAALVLLAAVLAWRLWPAGRAVPGGAALRAVVSTLAGALRRLSRAVAHLRLLASGGWRERYRHPWVLVIGEAGSGKSSLLATLAAARRSQDGPPPRTPADLAGAVPDTGLLWLRQGALFDPAGARAAVDAEGQPSPAWHELLQALVPLRPERALDAVVLVVSARSLLQGDAAARLRLGLQAAALLESLRERLGLLLPVHVVVTQCDAIAGFQAHWRATLTHPAELAQIVGWSAPGGLEPAIVGVAADAAFDAIGQRLAALQLDTAARERELADRDGWFLFARRFDGLREALREHLALAFREQAWQSGFACRGLYFCGALSPSNQAGPRADLAFVDELFTAKVLKERGLARATRPARWSRDRLQRGLQLAGVGAALLACLGVGLAAVGLAERVRSVSLAASQTGVAALADGSAAPGKATVDGCPDTAELRAALDRARVLGGDLSSAWMPLSLLLAQPRPELVQRVAEEVLGAVLWPALSCRLQQRVTALSSVSAARANGLATASGARPGGSTLYQDVRDETLDRAARTAAVRSLIDDLILARSAGAQVRSAQRHAALQRLLAGLYQLDLAPPSWPRSDALSLALDASRDSGVVARWSATRETMLRDAGATLLMLTRQLHGALLARVHAGGALLAALEPARAGTPTAGRSATRSAGQTKSNPASAVAPAGPAAPLADRVRLDTLALLDWLDWLRSDWLPLDAARNPCTRDAAALSAAFDKLHAASAERARLDEALSPLVNRVSCFDAARGSLLGLRWAPHGMLLQPLAATDRAPSAGAVLNPAITLEVRGLQALAGQSYLQAAAWQPFSCNPSSAGWSGAELGQALALTREYQQFAAARGLRVAGSADADTPLFDRIARVQLERAMNDALRRAQPNAAPAAGPASLSTAEQKLAQLGAETAKAQEPLFAVLQMYRQLGMPASGRAVAQCARSQARAALQQVQSLATASRLWSPPLGQAGQPPLDIGSAAMVKDYLAAQLARAQVLVAYAEPFAALLRNTQPADDGAAANEPSLAFWSRTASELARYLQFQDSAGQVGQLDALVQRNAAAPGGDSCAARLSGTAPADDGNDLFSERRRALSLQLSLRCETNVFAHYQALAQAFNQSLSGRYPFGASSAADADPAEVRQFLAAYADQITPLKTALAASKDARAGAALVFLEQLERSSNFLRSSFGQGEPARPINLTVTFRALSSASPGSEQVVSWALSAGARVLRYPGLPPYTLDWPFGEALSLDLIWASGSVWRPSTTGGATTQASADLEVDGATASFTSGGQWALLRWIETHRPRQGPAVDPADTRRVLLEFTVPVLRSAPGGSGNVTGAAAGQARLYLGLNLTGLDPKTQAPVALIWPGAMPRVAPFAAPVAGSRTPPAP